MSFLFDHASRQKNTNYINGHCFVSLTLCIPVYSSKGTPSYLSVPIGYCMWKKGTGITKLDLAKLLILNILPVLKDYKVIILCDSWYAKQPFLPILNEGSNLNIITNVRYDSSMYTIYSSEPSHKRGRPKKKGEKITINDFEFQDTQTYKGYNISMKRVLAKIFNSREVTAIVTSSKDSNFYNANTRRINQVNKCVFCYME